MCFSNHFVYRTNVGPSTSASVSSDSGNTIAAASGLFFEDYYYDTTCKASGGFDYLDGKYLIFCIIISHTLYHHNPYSVSS